MTHFTVAVFTTDDGLSVDDLLAPYDEEITVAPYVSHTKAELIQQERNRIQKVFNGSYANWRKNPGKYEAEYEYPGHINYPKTTSGHINYLKTIPDRMQWTDEQIYQVAAENYEGCLNADGDVLSTYNPNSKWDWYEIGGRWKDILILKDNTQCDEALVSEIDFEAMRKRDVDKLTPYKEAMKERWSFTNEEYMRKLFRDEAEYIRLDTTFRTWAVVTPNGEWHTHGDADMFGTTCAAAKGEREWIMSYHERFIKPAIEKDWWMSFVECYI